MKLVGYLSLGYPNIESTKEIADLYVETGVDVLEIDFPARDPYLDSELIQSRMKGALENSDNYDDYIDAILDIRAKHQNAEIFILAYEKTIQEIGIDKFISFMHKANVKDMIYVGGNNQEVKSQLISNNIGLASYVQLDLNEKDLSESRSSNGFIYLQAKRAEMNPKYPTLASAIEYLRENEAKNKEIYCGVGVSTAEDVRLVNDSKSDGVFIGSTFLKLFEDKKALVEKIKELKKETI